MRVIVVTPPAPVITQEEAAQHLRLGDSVDEYQLLESITAAATAHIDGPSGWLGRAIGVQTLDAYLPSFGVMSIALPYPPAIDIVSIDYVDEEGTAITLDSSRYELTGNLLRPAWPNSWPSAQWRGGDGEPVRIRYRAGYEALPAPIRAAILLMVGDLFEFRETATAGSISSIPMSATVERLLAPFRVWA